MLHLFFHACPIFDLDLFGEAHTHIAVTKTHLGL
jgi:hypothetical protein